jgi:hypothetical protein
MFVPRQHIKVVKAGHAQVVAAEPGQHNGRTAPIREANCARGLTIEAAFNL